MGFDLKMKPKILGTGLAGLVGSRIVELLSSLFEFSDLPITKGFDITKPETIEKEVASSGAEIMIHLAAFTDVNAAWKENENKDGLCYRINTLGTKNIANLCARYNKFLLHFSTDFVFDGEKETSYTETDKPHPIEWYGQTKFWAEEEVKDSGSKYCIVRIAYPFRANFADKPDIIRKIINGLRENKLSPMFADQKITPTFIDDIALGIKEIIGEKTEGIFHLTGSSFVSPFALSQMIAEVFGFNKEQIKKGNLAEYIKNNPNSRPYQRNLSLSNEKSQEILKIEMKTIDEALACLKSQSLL